MFDFDKEAVKELAKSLGRAVWFAAIGAVVAWLQATFLNGEFNELTVVVVGFVVKALDRYVHVNSKSKRNGLAPRVLQG